MAFTHEITYCGRRRSATIRGSHVAGLMIASCRWYAHDYINDQPVRTGREFPPRFVITRWGFVNHRACHCLVERTSIKDQLQEIGSCHHT